MARRVACRTVLAENSGQPKEALTERSFAGAGASSGIVMLQVNWGRYWKRGPDENAQLQRLAFRRLSAAGGDGAARDWALEPVSTLLARPAYAPYVNLLDAGEYALSGFKVKVAAPANDVRVANAGSDRLIVDGRPAFDSYVDEFRRQYPYAAASAVTFRLFPSEYFGAPYELPPHAIPGAGSAGPEVVGRVGLEPTTY